MTQESINRHTVSTDDSVKCALDRLDTLSGKAMVLFATDAAGRLQGTVTGGDIRRALLRGVSLDAPVAEAMNRSFTAIESGEDPAGKVAEGKRRHLCLVPVTDGGHITDIIDLARLKALLPIDAVLMAGGRGERLRPLTLSTPKPLLEVGGKPIIDRNIEMLEEYGVRNIFVTVNYLHDRIEEHFRIREAKETDNHADVTCVLEPRRLGTLGSLALVEGLRHDNILVMNSDLLTNLDFEKMWRLHTESGAHLTMGAVPYTVSVPFAIMRTEGSKVTGLEEKPTYNYFINGGVYMMRRELLERITKGEYLDAPNFIESLIADGLKVECFPIEGRWIDIGSPDDFRAANELLS
ncbi:MAG: nucleotidyltransferase family protein [Muribaculaceae bacterium]|nr:nucleotidyltransferase family protein [Muribaculaceae bacterium]